MTTNTLQGKALVTGASSGIGATYARQLAAKGLDLVLVARDQARLDTLAQTLAADFGVAVEVVKADLTQAAELQALEQRLLTDSSISVLINNAGMTVEGGYVDADPARVEAMIQLNVLAPTRLSMAAAKAMAARGQGAIVNLASVVALIPEQFAGAYGATKAFVLGLTQSLATELADKGVRVQGVLPGLTRTEIFERSGHDLAALPPEWVMEVEDMVAAAIKGFEMGEGLTLPSLPDMADFAAYDKARLAMGPRLSLSNPAPRYR
ncbi:SDR family NAD(P)-dependent oxidoreductase [Gallaecimonas xiamenensis]|uniref:NADP-dependent 3-hydroxy acid dehydrogenase YdfG n=1 Tax=Gallaecimonas xiamenensis 3-C-1 TaxID=745411 RepID=K2JRJ4_9GAMM|nr:SDR family oxidoreductase [Gallaecimonas xiamenensis]EKE78033.1 short chain dehydrogenase/reductase family oxidoreductase [Gallaecimonas xiamenensis 3-C-1]